jgi:hypothetical protein
MFRFPGEAQGLFPYSGTLSDYTTDVGSTGVGSDARFAADYSQSLNRRGGSELSIGGFSPGIHVLLPRTNVCRTVVGPLGVN